MSHALTTRADGFTEMAYVGETPWHNLGQELQEGADLETWKKAAGMDWEVRRAIVNYRDASNTNRIFDGNQVLYRSDTGQALGLASPKYKPVNPGDVLEFFRDLVDGEGFHLNTAGTLFGGKRLWALARIGDDATVLGKDKVGGYLLLSTSCDRSLATSARFTTVRVVCNNTLSMALAMEARADTEVRIRHTAKLDPKLVHEQLGIATGKFKSFMEAARLLASTPVSKAAAAEFTAELLRANNPALRDEVKESKPFLAVMDLFEGNAMGADLKSAKGTLWGLLNSVTEYVDHHAKAKTDSHRMNSAWFGTGDKIKTDALERALALAA